MKNEESELLKIIIANLNEDYNNIVENSMTDESRASMKRLIALFDSLVPVLDNYHEFMDYKMSDNEFNLVINEFFTR